MAEHEMIIRTLFLLDEGININANNIARFSPCCLAVGCTVAGVLVLSI